MMKFLSQFCGLQWENWSGPALRDPLPRGVRGNVRRCWRAEDTTPSNTGLARGALWLCALERKPQNVHRASSHASLRGQARGDRYYWREEKRQPRRTQPQRRHCLLSSPAELQQHQHFSRYPRLLRLRLLYYQLSFRPPSSLRCQLTDCEWGICLQKNCLP